MRERAATSKPVTRLDRGINISRANPACRKSLSGGNREGGRGRESGSKKRPVSGRWPDLSNITLEHGGTERVYFAAVRG